MNTNRPRLIPSFCTLILCLAPAIFLIDCAQNPKPPSQNGGLYRERNEGYGLLYQLMSENSDVDKILVIKHADEPLGSLIKEIAAACKDAKTQMDEWPKTDNRIEYDESDLPKLETKARDLESDSEAKSLLFSSGKTFEARLIFNEAEAMGYATNLCDALVDHVDDQTRKDFLKNLSKQCSDFRDRLMDLLSVKS